MEKLNAIFQNSPEARVKLVATQISPEIREFTNAKNIGCEERPFASSDLDDVKLVIVAINDKEASRQIYQQCQAKNILANVADTPELCDFYLSSVVHKGNLKIAISTNGKSPTVAKRVKEVLSEAFPEEIDEVLNNLENVRAMLSGDFAEKVEQLNQITSVLAPTKT
jgi:siroheme synthase-like protein